MQCAYWAACSLAETENVMHPRLKVHTCGAKTIAAITEKCKNKHTRYMWVPSRLSQTRVRTHVMHFIINSFDMQKL
jgi:hypothetical protein